MLRVERVFVETWVESVTGALRSLYCRQLIHVSIESRVYSVLRDVAVIAAWRRQAGTGSRSRRQPPADGDARVRVDYAPRAVFGWSLRFAPVPVMRPLAIKATHRPTQAEPLCLGSFHEADH